ncbi:MAG: flagellar basal body rod protein FlgB [bacterium]
MFIDSLTGQTIEMAKKGLDSATLRHNVISNNVANVNTPGFKKQSVIFEDALKENKISAKRLNPKHIPFSYEKSKNSGRIITENDTIYRNDGNNVDLDKEMEDLAKNAIYYNSIATRLARKFSLLKLVAQGGR